MAKYIGIDFGMQNLKVWYFDEDEKQDFAVNLEGSQNRSADYSLNAVYYRENDECELQRFFFGSQLADEARKAHDKDYVAYIKRELQKKEYNRTVCDGKYTFTALDIITDIFKQVYLKLAENRLDISAPVMLTVPVVFSEAQKEMLKYCASNAGFSVNRIITEPFACIFSEELYDEFTKDVEDGNVQTEYVILFDFGASTLDVCLMKISGSEKLTFETMGVTGLSLGGKDITELIADYFRDVKYKESIEELLKTDSRLDEDILPSELFDIAENMKNNLYYEEDTSEVQDLFFGKRFTLKRQNMNDLLDDSGCWKMIEKRITEMFNSTDEFDESDMKRVTKIAMTGGSSRIQFFRDKIMTMFTKAELIGDPEENESIYYPVSSGAVNYARKEGISITNRSPMRIGVDLSRGFEILLERNTVFNQPGRAKQISQDWLNQHKWQINIYQTIEEGIRNRTSIGKDGILYAGTLQLNKSLYVGSNKDIIISLRYTDRGIRVDSAFFDETSHKIEQNIILGLEI